MIQVSSNLTLFLKIFVPTFYLVFFGAFTAALWLTGYEHFGQINGDTLRYVATGIYLVFLVFLYFTVVQLKRVEMDLDHVYITNYLKHIKYPLSGIERIQEREFPFIYLVTIHLKKTGQFGKKITFLPSRSRFDEFLKHHPTLARDLLEMETKSI